MVHPLRRVLLVLVLGCLALAGSAALGARATAATPDSTPESGWGVNGPVYATAIAGHTVIVGGSFSAAVNPNGGSSTPRANLAAFDLDTGALLSWRADTNDVVRALATDGTSVWVGGQFTTVGGVRSLRAAKLSVAGGTVDQSFSLGANNTVYALELDGSSLYVGGDFTSLGGGSSQHRRIAEVARSTGAASSTFQGTANGSVLGIAASPTSDVIYLAGKFSNLTGQAREGVGVLSAASGATTSLTFSRSVRPSLGVDVSADGSRIYGAGGGTANAVSAWSTTSGLRIWNHVAMGDIQAIRYFDGEVYFGFHEGYQNDTTVRLLAADASSGAIDNSFRPTFNQFWGVRAIAVTADGLVAGGQFTNVGGTGARNVVRFLP